MMVFSHESLPISLSISFALCRQRKPGVEFFYSKRIDAEPWTSSSPPLLALLSLDKFTVRFSASRRQKRGALQGGSEQMGRGAGESAWAAWQVRKAKKGDRGIQKGLKCHYKAMCVLGGGGEREERKGGQVLGVVRRDRGLKSEQPHQSKCTPPQKARYGPLRHNGSVMQP